MRTSIKITVKATMGFSGAGTNLKMREHFFWSCPSTSGASTSTILVVLVSAFVMVSTAWLVSCLLFSYSRCPRAQLFVKVGRDTVPVPYGVGATGRPILGQ